MRLATLGNFLVTMESGDSLIESLIMSVHVFICFTTLYNISRVKLFDYLLFTVLPCLEVIDIIGNMDFENSEIKTDDILDLNDLSRITTAGITLYIRLGNMQCLNG